jgi:hypothetical protein
MVGTGHTRRLVPPIGAALRVISQILHVMNALVSFRTEAEESRQKLPEQYTFVLEANQKFPNRRYRVQFNREIIDTELTRY